MSESVFQRIRTSRRARLAVPLVLTAIVFLPTLWIGFINDDVAVIQRSLKTEPPHLLSLISPQEVMSDLYYRPLVSLSFMTDYFFWGWDPAGFRVTNLLLHLFMVWLVMWLALALDSGEGQAVLAALWFGLLPIHETSLYWIPGRTDILCAVFYVAALIAFISWHRTRRASRLVLSLLAFAAALLSKEMALSLPLLIPVVVWYLCRNQPKHAWIRTSLLQVLPFVALALLVLGARWGMLNNSLLTASNPFHENASFIHVMRNLATYGGLLAIPFGHYTVEQLLSEYPLLYYIGAFMLTVSVVALVWYLRHQPAFLILTLLWILVTLIPVSRLVMRWYLYLPSVGFALLLAAAFSRWSRAQRQAALVVGVILGLIYAATDVTIAGDWIRTSSLARQLLGQVRSSVELKAPKPGLAFVTIPGKIGTTPLFQLGFTTTVQHYFRNDSLDVQAWSKVVLSSYPGRLHLDSTDHGSYTVAVESDGFIFLDDPDVVTGRMAEKPGVEYRSDVRRMEILKLNAKNKVQKVLITPDDPAGENVFWFDGERFVRLR